MDAQQGVTRLTLAYDCFGAMAPPTATDRVPVATKGSFLVAKRAVLRLD